MADVNMLRDHATNQYAGMDLSMRISGAEECNAW
jgi:hypothetical protein